MANGIGELNFCQSSLICCSFSAVANDDWAADDDDDDGADDEAAKQAGRQQLGNQATRQLNNQKATAGKAAFYMSRIRNEAQIARISRKSRDESSVRRKK